jgi:5'(3')-deoxyribonucleotidase
MVDGKPVLAVDMDEVLCGTAQALIDFHNERFQSKLTLKDFISYKYEEVWGGTKEEAIEKVRLFYSSDHFSERMTVVPGAKEALSVCCVLH